MWIYRLRPESTHMDKIDDDGLTSRLKSGIFTGMELVRPFEGSGEWVPVWTLPLFRQTFSVTEMDARALAERRQKKKGPVVAAIIGGAVAMFAMVGAATALASHPATQSGPNPAVFLLAGMGGIMALAGFFAAIGAKAQQAKKAAAAASTTPGTIVTGAAPIASSELERALHGLEEAVAAAPPAVKTSVDLVSLRKNADSVRRARSSLASLCASPSEPLAKELDDAKKALAASPGSTAYSERVAALQAHLDSLEGMRTAANEAEARERALVHQIEALHLAIARAAVDGTQTDELLERLRALRDRLDDESRIADSLDTQAKERAKALGPLAAAG